MIPSTWQVAIYCDVPTFAKESTLNLGLNTGVFAAHVL
jgi:hypothetical protein